MRKISKKIKNRGIIALLLLVILILISNVIIIVKKNYMSKTMEKIIYEYIDDELNSQYKYKIETNEKIDIIDEWKGKLKIRYVDDIKCFVEGKSLISIEVNVKKFEYNMRDFFVIEKYEGEWSVVWNKSYINT